MLVNAADMIVSFRMVATVIFRVRVELEPARGRRQWGDGENLIILPAHVAVVGDDVGARQVTGEGGAGEVVGHLASAGIRGYSSGLPAVFARWLPRSRLCSPSHTFTL